MLPDSIRVYLNTKMLCMVILGFASGLPLALTGGTLAIWLKENGVDKASIGLFSAVATPYALKFLWAPFIDHLRIPILSRLLGRRRSWILVAEIFVFVSIVAMAFAGVDNIMILAALTVALAFSSATHDIVIDAYRVESLTESEQAAGAASAVFGYRLGMFASGVGALIIAELYGWPVAYMAFAILIFCGFLSSLIIGEKDESRADVESGSIVVNMKVAVIEPFTEFVRRNGWQLLLLFAVTFKLGDAFLGTMSNVFYLEMGFTKIDIAAVVKTYGMVATFAGAFIGGAMVASMGMMRALVICGILQAVTNAAFIYLIYNQGDLLSLGFVVTAENLAGGMGTAAFVGFLGSICNRQFTATQYALLSSLASFGRTWFSTPSGFIAEGMGWEWFFIISVLASLPGIAFGVILHRRAKESKTL